MKQYFPTLQIENVCNDSLTMKYTNIDFSFLNTIRRIIKSQIPVLAINTVRFEEYSGYLEEETLAHRISLLPLVCKKIHRLNYQKECTKCTIGCHFCNVTFTLQKKAVDDDIVTNVYSNDLKLVDPTNKFSTEILQFPKNYHGILLCRLNPGETIKLQCTASKGHASEHAKFSACTVCFYKQVEKEPNSYIFTIETNGNIHPIDVFRQSLDIYIRENMNLKKYINKYMTDTKLNITVPYQDTILNSLQKEIIKTFESNIDLFLYKKSHILSETKTSTFQIYYDNDKESSSDIKSYINTSINRLVIFSQMILSNLSENQYDYKIFGRT